MQQQFALAVFIEIALPVRIRMSMSDQFVAARDAGRDQFRAMIVERRIDQRARRHGEVVKQFQATPCAHPVAVLTPTVIEHVGLRRDRTQRRTQPFAESEVFDIEAQIHRKTGIARPAESIGIRNGPIGKASVRGDRLARTVQRSGHIP